MLSVLFKSELMSIKRYTICYEYLDTQYLHLIIESFQKLVQLTQLYSRPGMRKDVSTHASQTSLIIHEPSFQSDS